MPVIEKNKKWRTHVPYQNQTNYPAVAAAIEAINAAVEWELLRPRTDETDYLLLKSGGHHHSAVGRQGGKQDVAVSDCRFTAVHEIMHGLGFHHEEKHAGFPWKGSTENWSNFNVEKLDPWDRKIFDSLKKKSSDFGARAKIKDFKASASSTTMQSLGKCDIHSVMMYRFLREAVECAQKAFPTQLPGNYTWSSIAGELTASDRNALRGLFPKGQA